MTGYTTEPESFVEKAADAGLKAINEFLGEQAVAEEIVILLRIKGQPEGELDSVTAGHNIEDGRDLIVSLASHLVQAGAMIGMEVRILPLENVSQG
jgi:hypothetical protein